METVLFQGKFCDWPDSSQIIKVKADNDGDNKVCMQWIYTSLVFVNSLTTSESSLLQLQHRLQLNSKVIYWEYGYTNYLLAFYMSAQIHDNKYWDISSINSK